MAVKKHPLYRTWLGMRIRCKYPNHISYQRYGGRGIKVCDRWQSFAAFLEDMEPFWQPGLTLDRIDTNGNYTPENCRWVTPYENNRRQRATVFLDTPWGELTIKEAAQKSGLAWQTVYWRYIHGKPPLAPVRKNSAME